MDNDGTGNPIEIIISTVGGEIYSGFNLVDQIENAKSPVTIHIMSMASSMPSRAMVIPIQNYISMPR